MSNREYLYENDEINYYFYKINSSYVVKQNHSIKKFKNIERAAIYLVQSLASRSNYIDLLLRKMDELKNAYCMQTEQLNSNRFHDQIRKSINKNI